MVKDIGRGMYEVKLAGDPQTYTVGVLGEQACSCTQFAERVREAEAEPDPLAKPRIYCKHIEAAANHHNTVARRNYQDLKTRPPVDYQRSFADAKDDLLHMLEEIGDDEPGTGT